MQRPIRLSSYVLIPCILYATTVSSPFMLIPHHPARNERRVARPPSVSRTMATQQIMAEWIDEKPSMSGAHVSASCTQAPFCIFSSFIFYSFSRVLLLAVILYLRFECVFNVIELLSCEFYIYIVQINSHRSFVYRIKSLRMCTLRNKCWLEPWGFSASPHNRTHFGSR